MAVARLWLAKISWFFLPLAVLLLGRAFWLHYAKRQGAPWTRWVTWTATLVSVGLWLPRVWMILSLWSLYADQSREAGHFAMRARRNLGSRILPASYRAFGFPHSVIPAVDGPI